MPQPNQYPPLPPEDQIREAIEFYYTLGLNDKKIALHMRDHYDTTQYGLSVSSIKRLRRKWNLTSTRQQKHTLESIEEEIRKIRVMYPLRGAEMIRKQLRTEINMRVPRPLILRVLETIEPDAVRARRHRRFKRRRFHAAGVNEIWAQDQHDKWGPRFGLWLHNSLDPFNGYNNWLKVWWTNKNPRLIAAYYINAVRKFGAIPLTTQSDPGSENYGVANVQTLLRHTLDPSLADTLQHRWKRKKSNIKSEANWSVFRRDFAPGYEDLFESGVVAGYYDVNNPLEKQVVVSLPDYSYLIFSPSMVFRWLAIPWLQSELDKWVLLRNRTPPRADTKKVLPHGIPELIREKPDQFGTLDFKIPIPMDLLDRLEAEYAPPDHPVFQLTPPPFHERAMAFYAHLGCPPVTFESFWDVYRQLLQCFQAHQDLQENAGYSDLATVISSHETQVRELEEESVALLEGMKELREGARVVAAAASGAPASDAADDELYASFSDEDESGDEDSDAELPELIEVPLDDEDKSSDEDSDAELVEAPDED